jgi:hypothetical protein
MADCSRFDLLNNRIRTFEQTQPPDRIFDVHGPTEMTLGRVPSIVAEMYLGRDSSLALHRNLSQGHGAALG